MFYVAHVGHANQASLQNLTQVTALVETTVEKQHIRERRLLMLIENMVETQKTQEKHLKQLVGRTTADVEEEVGPDSDLYLGQFHHTF